MRTYPDIFGWNRLILLLIRRTVWAVCGLWITSATACAPAPVVASLPKVRAAATASGAERADIALPPIKASADKAENPPPAKPAAATRDASYDGHDPTDEPFDRLREIVIDGIVVSAPPEKPVPEPPAVETKWKAAARSQAAPPPTPTHAEDDDPFNRLRVATSDPFHAPAPKAIPAGAIIPIDARTGAAAASPPPLPLPILADSSKVAPMPDPPPPPLPRVVEPPPAAAAAPPKPASAAPVAPAPVLQSQAVETVAPAPPAPPAPPNAVVAAAPPRLEPIPTPAPADEPAKAAPEVAAAAPPPPAANPGKAGNPGAPRQEPDRLLYLILAQTFAILAVVVLGPLAFLLALCYVVRRRGSGLGSLFKVEVINNTVFPGLTAAPAGAAPPAARRAPVEDGAPTPSQTFDLGPTFEEHQKMLGEAADRQAEALHRKVFEQNVQLSEQMEGVDEEDGAARDEDEPHAQLRKQIRDLRHHLEELGENRDAPPFPSYVYEEVAEGGAEAGQASAGAPTPEAPEEYRE